MSNCYAVGPSNANLSHSLQEKKKSHIVSLQNGTNILNSNFIERFVSNDC